MDVLRRLLCVAGLCFLAIAFSACSSAPLRTDETVNVRGVITVGGEPAKDFKIGAWGDPETITAEDGFFLLDGVPVGRQEIQIRAKYFSRPRYNPTIDVPDHDVTRNFEIVPYYAADHGAFEYDWRLHRSWGNAIDDPFDTTSMNALRENTRTVSGVVLKPIYIVGITGEVVWFIPGALIGASHGAVPVLMGGEFAGELVSVGMLAGFMPIEAVVKAVEVPVKTILWPLDRLVAKSKRRQLHETRAEILQRHE
ncbi:hypothetical protein KQI84_16365 [bacterium]|nr:hypothetical protein [bacterium]